MNEGQATGDVDSVGAAKALERCVSIDLEVGRNDGRIHRFAAVRADSGKALVFAKGDLRQALLEPDAFCAGAGAVLGHNLIAFDRPHLAAVAPGLKLLTLPVVDTLRLNPLAFPRNPYHHLVKHYQDGQLRRGRRNDPELDARLALEVFADQQAALAIMQRSAPDLVCAWHGLNLQGADMVLGALRGALRPAADEQHAAIAHRLAGCACRRAAAEANALADREPWPLAYALAWLAVAGGQSVMPPWVRHQFPLAGALIRQWRDTPCGDPTCDWCSARHDARRELKRWFGADWDFRPHPVDADSGRPLQQAIVEAAMRGEHALGILPTGTGKSLCYQIPALSRYAKTGALTVVISPLVALMADQVAGLEARGLSSAAAINGLLTVPERADVLDRVRLGDVGILIIAPEQLRSTTVRRVLTQREIGAWVLDEAHCLSKWGHDFRPDYRYVARFIGERAGDGPVPPILCLTATAKPDVVDDIVQHFKRALGQSLRVFDGGAQRDNLAFEVVPTSAAAKGELVHRLVGHHLPDDAQGGAIVYCATRRQTEEMAQYLALKDVAAAHFHAGLPPERKKQVQQDFIRGDLRVIVATNAFGMGIDKPDVRLVIHADIPGSLENYLQEAGRAGRDRLLAHCILLYTEEDVERQFGMSARSRLSQRDIQSILRALRQLDRRKRCGGTVIATAGEILAEDQEGSFVRDQATDDTRVRTAISWLEDRALLRREENRVQVFPSSLRVASMEEAGHKLAKQSMTDTWRARLLRLVDALIDADADEGVSTDELMLAAGMSSDEVRQALFDLERLGIASNDTAITAFVQAGVARSSAERLERTAAMETALIAMLREQAPDLVRDQSSQLYLRVATQQLKDEGHADALPEKVLRLIRSVGFDGRDEDQGVGSLDVRMIDGETLYIRLRRPWQAIDALAGRRRQAAQRLLAHLLGRLPPGARGADLLVETTLGDLLSALRADLFLSSQSPNLDKLLSRALLWLHEQEVIRLNRGLAVFRSAMTIHLDPQRRGFARIDFEPLAEHYREQGVQIHVMAEYARIGLEAVAEAVRLAADYFRLDRDSFIRAWLPNREKELERQTTRASWQRIVEALGNPIQERIVADERSRTNVLVLAGPGSGKTRVLVHRIAWLVRVRREKPEGILALAYNHHAAVDIRRRLRELLDTEARGVTVLTCHALAMRLTGASFAGKRMAADDDAFRDILAQAIDLLEGKGLPPEDADVQRERLLAGFRWILVDEYQDIGPEQYRLIAAIAGRTRQDEDTRLSLFAVGDDDQNIYAFRGASVEFIRRFEQDYATKPGWLVENYRSSAHIIAAANRVIAAAAQRLKSKHPIVIDRARRRLPAGGDWAARDPVGRGRVQILPAGADAATQALLAVAELERLAACDADWDWRRVAVIAREWRLLDPLRAHCEARSIPVQAANEDEVPVWQLREMRALLAWIHTQALPLLRPSQAMAWLDDRPHGPWWTLLREGMEDCRADSDDAEMTKGALIDWLAEWSRNVRRRQHGLLLLTAHRAKGLEFDHMLVLDGGWDRLADNEDRDASRRLYYVAMTRARQTLALMELDRGNRLLDGLRTADCAHVRAPLQPLPTPDAGLVRMHRRLDPGSVDLGFAGRQPPEASVHAAIAALEPGAPLSLERDGEAWRLRDAQGRIVGKLAKSFTPPVGMHCETAQVAAIIVRHAEQTPEDFRALCRCPHWETVLPELVWAPR